MKKYFKTALSLMMAILGLAACSKNRNDGYAVNPNNYYLQKSVIQAQVSSLPLEELSTAERNSILYMREEEKLARDVYEVLYSKWKARVFANISLSEQTHMDAILLLIDKYDLTDPVVTDQTGVFASEELQAMYTSLTAGGMYSILAAYTTGATIEDLDLFDLDQAIAEADNRDVKLVFENLAKGSRNHLRSFYRNIINAGGTYTPQYISQEAFDAIINSPMENGAW